MASRSGPLHRGGAARASGPGPEGPFPGASGGSGTNCDSHHHELTAMSIHPRYSCSDMSPHAAASTHAPSHLIRPIPRFGRKREASISGHVATASHPLARFIHHPHGNVTDPHSAHTSPQSISQVALRNRDRRGGNGGRSPATMRSSPNIHGQLRITVLPSPAAEI
jgi:hypothetical protein